VRRSFTLRPRRGLPVERDRSTSESGQSLVELVMIVPVLLLIVLVAIDFGRIYLGYVNLQQMARVAGAYASDHASAWKVPNNAAKLAAYQNLVANDAAAINCELPKVAGKVHVPDPAFPAGFDMGDPIQINIPCNFDVLTPIISQIIGGKIAVSASTTYPIREGVVATVPGGGGPILLAPVADFVGTPQSGYGQTTAAGYAPLSVKFTDLSRNGPTSWQWDFGDGNGLDFAKGPHTVQYACDKAPGEECVYSVNLTVGSSGGFDSETKTDYVVVKVPPDTGPVAEFTVTPNSGVNPLNVQFQFVDVRAGGVTYSTYEWDFDGDGTFEGNGQTVNHQYASPGAYDVSLRVTEAGTGDEDTQTKKAFVLVNKKICTVPDFANKKKNSAQGIWNAAGFTTSVLFAPGSGNYTIRTQSIVGGVIDPQPNGCASTITVGP
jgi:PKD repeat protein